MGFPARTRRPVGIGFRTTAAAMLLCSLLTTAQASESRSSPHASTLTVEPSAIQLITARSQAHLLVIQHFPDGKSRDVTDKARLIVANPALIDLTQEGSLRPLKDGTTTIRATFEGASAAARVLVKETGKPTPVSFANEIVPVLTRLGCNQGACHGSQYGKGGFKLSLAGFDPDLDYTNIARQHRTRRIVIAAPEQSLLLLKPLMAVPHAGGRRLEPGSPDYRLLVQWLKEGAHGPQPTDPTVSAVSVFPSERVMQKGEGAQRLVVQAAYSDGTTRDVTAQARIASLNDGIAACTPEGIVRPVGNGQTAIMVRYSGQATVATFIIPYASVAGVPAAKTADPRSIDGLVEKKQRQLGLLPSPLCDDATFIRRVSYDLIGTPPTPEEWKAFVADKTPDKRARLVDTLLARPEYADYWALKWGDLLRCNRMMLQPKGMWRFSAWIHAQLEQNRPVNQFVHELLVARGSTFTNGPANFYRVVSTPQELAETTSQVFLGNRLQCAKCHHHPFERWSQADYYQLAAFFARVGVKGSDEFGMFGNEQIIRINNYGEVTHPKTGAVMSCTPLGATPAARKGGSLPDPDAGGDRRQLLADWLTDKRNPFFARNLANRYWGYLFGKGIVNPIDDQRVTNPPTNRELLDALADELVKSDFDLKHLLRVICLSKTYQHSSQPLAQNRKDELFFTHYSPKRLPAESLLDAVDFACGTREKYPEMPLGTRAIQLPDPNIASDFLDTFGRPQRLISCECERVVEPNLSQTLRLMNGDLINRKVADGNGRIAALIKAKTPDDAILDALYLVTLQRYPQPPERGTVRTLLAASKDHKAVFEDVLLTLLNSNEFLFNR